MSCLIEGYNYDIFISYRQKDNKHDGWVTEFVDNLKGELESTFKEEIRVYFDINPHDGLLETHDVDESLKDKLKCLIFIPIISRTYCDPKSFAWEHEFKVFVKQASRDPFGLKVKLPNGNVSNRVLPIRIHDLDITDIKECESVLGGLLRGVDFIYKSPGVNRPLRAVEDHPQDNHNKTYYRDQINKVANAVKEIINAIGNNEQKSEEFSQKIVEPLSFLRKSNKKKIITGVLILIVLIILGFLFFHNSFKPQEIIDKSIAVMPFKSLSDDPDKQYLADGVMEAILLHLAKIEDLRVMPRTSVEQYRKTEKTLNEIGKELDVTYLLEGSFQMYGDKARLIVRLIMAGKEGYVWADEYVREWKDIFAVQSEVAQSIARELKAAITPEEKLLIEKTPKINLTAYDFYQRGIEELTKYEIYTRNKATLQKAEDLFHKAIKYDSTFAQAYTALARVYWSGHYWSDYLSENFMDSLLTFTDKALSIDNQLSEAYILRGNYYYARDMIEKAYKEYDIALKYNPNDYRAYIQRAYISFTLKNYVAGFDNAYKAITRYKGGMLPQYLRYIAQFYLDVGFTDKATFYYKEAYDLDGDSAAYFKTIANIKWVNEDFIEARKWKRRSLVNDSVPDPDDLVRFNIEGLDQEAYLLAIRLVKQTKDSGLQTLNNFHRIGYTFFKSGLRKEADYYFKEQIKYGEESINLGRVYATSKAAQYDLAATYAFLGDKEKAYQNLNEFSKLNFFPKWWITLIKYDPLFDNIKSEERFKKILENMEAKYLAEHERVRKWLEEQGML